MDLPEYRKEFLENVKAVAASESIGTIEAFVKVSCDYLVSGELFDDYELSYHTGAVSNRKFRIDAYSYDDYDKSMVIVIADYHGMSENKSLTMSEATMLFGRIRVFVQESINGKLKNEVEISTPQYDLIDKLCKLQFEIRKLKLFIITDKELSKKVESFDETSICDIPCEYHVWDIMRFHRVLGIGEGKEPIEIDLASITNGGIPCLPASNVTIESCQCYLCVLPGEFLADIYDLYGSRLLEGNVRTFLSARGNVNKSIRKTIMGNEKNMFFAYNNGIAATASDIKIETINGMPMITYIRDLQIVNGGQTTASLSNTRYKDRNKDGSKISLEGIFVQMKLTVFENEEKSNEIIPNISRCSNSQNKVSEADFFSNHEFNIRMQKISRTLYAPAASGVQYETHWFYERARGQYENEQSKMTPSQKKHFVLVNPKGQLFDKTMLAKLENAWRLSPHIASAGAQKSFKKWAESIVAEWDKNSDVFNEHYYKNIIALLIIFRTLERAIPKMPWYESGYRANIIVYTMAFFRHMISFQYPSRMIDLGAIWQKQKLDDVLEKQLLDVAKYIFDFITDESRPVINVTEWCKRELCWEKCKRVSFKLDESIKEYLKSEHDEESEVKAKKKDYKETANILCQTEVYNKGAIFWKSVASFLVEHKLLTPKEMGIIKTAVEINKGAVPSEKQSVIIMELLKRAEEEGYVVPTECSEVKEIGD